MTLCCDQDGAYNNSGLTEDTKGIYKNNKINCPFESYAARHNDLWYLEVRNNASFCRIK